MRDDRHKWQSSASWGDAIALGSAMLRRLPLERQTLVSGPNVLSQVEVPVVQWPDIAPDGCYALSLRRDRVLIVNGPAMQDGWDQKTAQAISDASDLYVAFELTGEDAIDLLKRGAEITLEHPSRSVSRDFFGVNSMIYRQSAEDRFILHVPTAMQSAVIQNLEVAAKAAR